MPSKSRLTPDGSFREIKAIVVAMAQSKENKSNTELVHRKHFTGENPRLLVLKKLDIKPRHWKRDIDSI